MQSYVSCKDLAYSSSSSFVHNLTSIEIQTTLDPTIDKTDSKLKQPSSLSFNISYLYIEDK